MCLRPSASNHVRTHIATRLGRHIFVRLCDQHFDCCVSSSWCFGEARAMVGWRGSLALAIRLTERGKCNLAHRSTLEFLRPTLLLSLSTGTCYKDLMTQYQVP